MHLTDLERRILWFRAYGVRWPAIANNLGVSYRRVRLAALSGSRKLQEMQEWEAKQVLATFGRAPGIFPFERESAPRPKLVTVEDLIGQERAALSELG